MYTSIISIILILLVLGWIFIPRSNNKFDTQEDYERGYIEAMKYITEGLDAQHLYDQCYNNTIEIDKWDKGWMDACVAKGAKEIK
jgi:hypothetical protein